MAVMAFGRDNPKYRRLYAAKDMRRKGYRKVGEQPYGKDRLLIYRRRMWVKGVTHDTFAAIYPDGSIKEHHSVAPRTVGW